jgi:hypothetical protein
VVQPEVEFMKETKKAIPISDRYPLMGDPRFAFQYHLVMTENFDMFSVLRRDPIPLLMKMKKVHILPTKNVISEFDLTEIKR